PQSLSRAGASGRRERGISGAKAVVIIRATVAVPPEILRSHPTDPRAQDKLHIPTMKNLLEQLVEQSRLVGANESLVLWGGGNNSVKTTAKDLLGNPIEVMLIKSSGSDMKTITPRQFPAVRLDYIAPLRSRAGDMSD